jgi:hypothetical protein
MAKFKSIVRLRGDVSGVNFYQNDGDLLARNTTSLTKEKIMTDPAFKRTRENMSEFGGMAKPGVPLRQALGDYYRTIQSGRANGRFSSAISKIIKRGAGSRGQRACTISANQQFLRGFEFNKELNFSSSFGAPFTITPNPASTSFILEVPPFTPNRKLLIPAGSTHFQLMLAAVVLSDYEYDGDTQEYVPLDAAVNGLYHMVETPMLDNLLTIGAPTTLTATLPGLATLPPDTSVAIVMALVFFEEVGADYYQFETGATMKIVDMY